MKKYIKKCVICAVLLYFVLGIGMVNASYDGTPKVQVKSGDLNPVKYDTASAYASACAHGKNRWTISNVNSVVTASGYIYYYNPDKEKYMKYSFSDSNTIKKTGTKWYPIEKRGIDIISSYEDVYAMSIYCKFNMQCKQCAAEESRTRTATE